jgi:Tat protein translocase TatB subunit
MFNVGPAEVLIILVVALLVLGPKKLPEAARQMGKAMTEFRRVTAGLQDEVRTVLDDHMTDPPLDLPPAVDPTAGLPPVAPVEEPPSPSSPTSPS